MLQTQAEKKIEFALTNRPGWMTHQQMGEIICLADEVGYGAYEEALLWMQEIRTEQQAEEYKDMLIALIENMD